MLGGPKVGDDHCVSDEYIVTGPGARQDEEVGWTTLPNCRARLGRMQSTTRELRQTTKV